MSTPSEKVTTEAPDAFLAALVLAIEADRPTGMEPPAQLLVQFGTGEVERPALVAILGDVEFPHPRMPSFFVRLEWRIRKDETTDLPAARAAWQALQKGMPQYLATAGETTRQNKNARLRFAMPVPEDDAPETDGYEFSATWQIKLIQM